MGLLGEMIGGLALLFAAWAIGYMVRHRRRRSKNPNELVISPLAGLTLAAALMGLQAIVQPQVRHTIAEQMEERGVEDANGDPPGGQEFQEQLRRVRNGEEVGELIARADPWGEGSPERDAR
jgi:hypothetical protein